MTAKELYDKSVAAMVHVVNEPENDIRHCRRAPMPTLRAMIYLRMRSKGFTWQEIARATNRGHSNVILGARKWEQIRTEQTPGWEQLLDINKRFDTAMDEVQDKNTRIHQILVRFGMPEENVAEATNEILKTNGENL